MKELLRHFVFPLCLFAFLLWFGMHGFHFRALPRLFSNELPPGYILKYEWGSYIYSDTNSTLWPDSDDGLVGFSYLGQYSWPCTARMGAWEEYYRDIKREKLHQKHKSIGIAD